MGFLTSLVNMFLTLILLQEHCTLHPSISEAQQFGELVEILIVQDDQTVL